MMGMASAAAVQQQLGIGCGITSPCSSVPSSSSPSSSASACPLGSGGCPQLGSRPGKKNGVRTTEAQRRGLRTPSYKKRWGGGLCHGIKVKICRGSSFVFLRFDICHLDMGC
jgi:hypothetical protein